MHIWKRTLALLVTLGLTLFGFGLAQDDEQQQQEEAAQQEAAQQQVGDQPQTRTFEIQGEEVAPLGEIQVGDRVQYDGAQTETIQVEVEVETGAIAFSANAPGDQQPNINLIGPNGYYENFEVPSGEQVVVDGLMPGVYSIAATDNGLQVAHTLVEVTSGEAVAVDFTLQDLAAFQDGEFVFDPQMAFPDEAFAAEETVAIEDTEFGEVTVETQHEDTIFVITGPDGYSREFNGSFTAGELAPGVYVIAGTREGDWEVQGPVTGIQIATSAVQVNVAQAVTFVPIYDIVGAEVVEAEGEVEQVEEVETEVEEVEDVAGGGEAEEEQQQEEQQQEEQQQEEQQEEDLEEEAAEEAEQELEEEVEEETEEDAAEEEQQQ